MSIFNGKNTNKLIEVKNWREIVDMLFGEFIEEYHEPTLKFFNNNWETIKLFSYMDYSSYAFYIIQHWENKIIRLLTMQFLKAPTIGKYGNGYYKKNIYISEERYDSNNIIDFAKSKLNSTIIDYLHISKFLNKKTDMQIRNKCYVKYFKGRSDFIFLTPSIKKEDEDAKYNFSFSGNIYLNKGIIMIYPLMSFGFAHESRSANSVIRFWTDTITNTKDKKRNDIFYLFENYFEEYNNLLEYRKQEV